MSAQDSERSSEAASASPYSQAEIDAAFDKFRSFTGAYMKESSVVNIAALHFSSDDTFAFVRRLPKSDEEVLGELYADSGIELDLKDTSFRNLTTMENVCIDPALNAKYALEHAQQAETFASTLLKIAPIMGELHGMSDVVGDVALKRYTRVKNPDMERVPLHFSVPEIFAENYYTKNANVPVKQSTVAETIGFLKSESISDKVVHSLDLRGEVKTSVTSSNNFKPVKLNDKNALDLTNAKMPFFPKANDPNPMFAPFDKNESVFTPFKIVDLPKSSVGKNHEKDQNKRMKIMVIINDETNTTVAVTNNVHDDKTEYMEAFNRERKLPTAQRIINGNPIFGLRIMFEHESKSKEVIEHIESKFHKRTFFDSAELQRTLDLTAKYVQFLNETTDPEQFKPSIIDTEEITVKKFIQGYFTVDSDPEHKFKASDLFDLLRSKQSQLDIIVDTNFRNRLAKYLQSLGLQKKRMSDGYYYYGLVKKEEVTPANQEKEHAMYLSRLSSYKVNPNQCDNPACTVCVNGNSCLAPQEAVVYNRKMFSTCNKTVGQL